MRTTVKQHRVLWWLWAVGNVLSFGVIVFILEFLGVVNVGGVVAWVCLVIGLAGIIMTWGHRPPFSSSAQPGTRKTDKNDSGREVV